MRILNLTQHSATAEQIAAGVVEPADKVAVQKLLTFEELPANDELYRRARDLADMAYGYDAAMIGGAPYLMSQLEWHLRGRDVEALYAFSIRETVEEKLSDGGIKKTQVFRHAGFVSTS